MSVINLRHQMAVVKEFFQEFDARDPGFTPYYFRVQDLLDLPSPRSRRLLPVPRRRSQSSPWGKTLLFPGLKLGTLLSPRQDPVPLSRPTSPSKESVKVVSLILFSRVICPFCSLMVLLRPCPAHPRWPEFMEVIALLSASYGLDLLLQN